MKQNVAIGFLGINLDNGKGTARWERWRPTVALCRQDDLIIHRFELLVDPKYMTIAQQVADDIEIVSPETVVVINEISSISRTYTALIPRMRITSYILRQEHMSLKFASSCSMKRVTYLGRYYSSHRPAEKTKAVRVKFRSLT